MTSEEKTNLIAEYSQKILPILPLAKKAYGSRAQTTPAHRASSEYTALLVEFKEKGGSLLELSKELGVAYSGLNRRVVTSSLVPQGKKTRGVSSSEPIEETLDRIKTAKSISPEEYHAQLAHAYHSGVSLSAIARGLGLANTYPLYYGVQRHMLREKKAASAEV
jgi:hypothetical protein